MTIDRQQQMVPADGEGVPNNATIDVTMTNGPDMTPPPCPGCVKVVGKQEGRIEMCIRRNCKECAFLAKSECVGVQNRNNGLRFLLLDSILFIFFTKTSTFPLRFTFLLEARVEMDDGDGFEMLPLREEHVQALESLKTSQLLYFRDDQNVSIQEMIGSDDACIAWITVLFAFLHSVSPPTSSHTVTACCHVVPFQEYMRQARMSNGAPVDLVLVYVVITWQYARFCVFGYPRLSASFNHAP